jgi:ADP-ribose pyrophosphatase
MNKIFTTVYESGPVKLQEYETTRGKRVMLDMGGDAVLIIPKYKDKYIIISQKRLGSEKANYEFPSGGIKNDELPIDAASRELLEETGSVGKISHLVTTEMLSGIVKFNLHIFYADILDFNLENQNLDHGEELQVELLSLDELTNLAKSINVVDSYLLLGLGVINIYN